ncbi:inositol monophosphatase family protein [Tenggerimyces flavus]|uniref:Inositol-1-monophosphatase n=1 Tax=Tenggerimyces flavus TaxID=1708749 RepID=A0ABV7YKY6_9ACTN|nr:inositol monophosphatase family protein [Tenggerimyces flavus]
MNASLLALAEAVAREAGELLLSRRLTSEITVASTKSSPTDVVTAMDMAAESLIRTRLLAARPSDAVLGEEGGSTSGSSSVTWVVDPLDGTVNYLYDLPSWSVSIAAEVSGSAVAGVVVCPPLGEVWTAVRGGGAFLNGSPLVASSVSRLDQALVGTGFSYEPKRRALQAELLTSVLPLVRDVRRIGSAAVDLCSVAAGRLDAFYESGLNRWDSSAGLLIATEAGAVSFGYQGDAPDRRLTAVAARGVAEPLRDLLDTHAAPVVDHVTASEA